VEGADMLFKHEICGKSEKPKTAYCVELNIIFLNLIS
jgi:hypothetical protein